MKKNIIIILLLVVFLMPIKTYALDDISILYYKYIGDCEEDTCVSKNLLIMQLMYLKASGYKTISIEDFFKWRDGEIELDDRSILLLLENPNDSIEDIEALYNYKINTIENHLTNFKNNKKKATLDDDINNISVYLMKNDLTADIFKNKFEGINEEETFDLSEVAVEIPVLNYHFIGDCNEVICLSVDYFEEHLKYLKDNNYKVLTMEEFIKWKNGEIELPKKSVLITFDDGGMGTSRLSGGDLIRLLEKYDLKATLYLITGFWKIDDYISPNLEIQTHTQNMHQANACNLRCATYNEALEDLKISLESIKDTKSFAYPFYYYNNDVINALKELNFQVAFAGGNRSAKRSDNNFLIPRQVIYDDTNLERFIGILNNMHY